MRRVYRRKRRFYHKRWTRRKKIFVLLFSFFFLISFLLYYLHLSITPILMKHAEEEVKSISLYMMNVAITDDIINQTEVDELYVTTKSQDTIKSIDFNTFKVNQLLKDINENVWKQLLALQEGEWELLNQKEFLLRNESKEQLKKGIIYEIPFGVVFNNSLLANMGPSIPVRLQLSGNINSYLKTNVKNYGINNALIEISIQMEVEEQVLLPFVSKKIKVSSEVPLAVKMIEGQVPNYYSTGIKENSPVISTIK